jgi:hypothetical protein
MKHRKRPLELGENDSSQSLYSSQTSSFKRKKFDVSDHESQSDLNQSNSLAEVPKS